MIEAWIKRFLLPAAALYVCPVITAADPYLVELLTPIAYTGYMTLSEYQVRVIAIGKMPSRTTGGIAASLDTHQQDLYYGGTFNFTRSVNGPHCLIWSRPVDGYPAGILDVEVWSKAGPYCRTRFMVLCTPSLQAFLDFSPKYVMFSGWVGDQV